MIEGDVLSAEDVRRVRRLLDDTQAEFAKRLGVGPVTVARWETGQRRCAGAYAQSIARLDPERRAVPAATRADATVSVLAHLVRTFFHGSTTKAVSALLDHEKLSDDDLQALGRLIESKKKAKREKR
jgi:transcriptional regulator with XRE-family HTH domain